MLRKAVGGLHPATTRYSNAVVAVRQADASLTVIEFVIAGVTTAANVVATIAIERRSVDWLQCAFCGV